VRDHQQDRQIDAAVAESTLPTTVGVFGGGRMGAGIAHAFHAAGSNVVVVERDAGASRAAHERVQRSLARSAQVGADAAASGDPMARLEVSTDPGALAACGLVVEAVPEDRELKAQVLGRVAALAPHAWLATNTSSLSIDGLAATLREPERLIGLHFFNPVPASMLVEVVVGARTHQDLVSLAPQWVAALRKTAIVVKDSPGFASSRLGVALALEAMRMLEAGVASAEDIDTAMTLGYKHPVGPLRTTDLVGLDIRLAIAEHLAREVGDHFEPPQILRRLVERGHLGRKSGQGFYTWS
jgi:3-hydroxybutyryl-CoA dehydrogenase